MCSAFRASPRSILPTPVFLFVLLALGGCATLDSTGRRLGSSVVDGATQSFKAKTSPAIESAVTNALRASRVQLDSASAELVARGNQALGQYEANVEQAVQGPLSEALQRLVSANIEAAGTTGRLQAGLLTSQLTADLARLTPQLDSAATHAAANATSAATTQLTEALRTGLRTALVEAAGEIADTAAARAAGAVRKEVDDSPLTRWLVRIGIALAVAAVGAVALRFYRELRRRQTALEVVTQVIRDSQDPRLREAVKARATQREVEPWLHDFLEERGYLGQKIPAPEKFVGDSAAGTPV